MKAGSRIIMNTGILYARMAITVFISLYATRLILTALGVTDFGIFNVVAGAISMLTFLNSAMASATQRFMSYAEGAGDFQKVKSIFNVSVVLHLIIALLVLLLLEVVGYFLFNGILKIPEARIDVAKLIFQFMIISTLFTIISVPYDAVINTHENMMLFAVLGVIEALFKLAIALYITYSAFDHLTAYGFLTAGLSIMLLIIRRMYCLRKYEECKINLKQHFSKPVFKEMTGFAGWTFLGSSSSMLANYGQGILMNMFFGTVVNAAQGISGQVSGQLGAFAVTMLKALNPIIDKSEGAGNRELMIKASLTGTKAAFLLLIFFYIPVFIEMPYIFNLWLKNVPEYAIIFCRLLLLRNLVEQLYITISSSISAVGNIRKFQIYVSILRFAPLLISYVLFYYKGPPYSLYLVFIGYSISESILTLYFSNKYYNLSIPLFLKEVIGRCILMVVLSTMLSLIPYVIMGEGIVRLITISFVSSLSLTITAWYIGFNSEERMSLTQVAQGVMKKIRGNKA